MASEIWSVYELVMDIHLDDFHLDYKINTLWEIRHTLLALSLVSPMDQEAFL